MRNDDSIKASLIGMLVNRQSPVKEPFVGASAKSKKKKKQTRSKGERTETKTFDIIWKHENGIDYTRGVERGWGRTFFADVTRTTIELKGEKSSKGLPHHLRG